MDNFASDELITFGEILKTFRKREKRSQSQLADKLDVHRNTIGCWERGDFLPDGRGLVLEIAHQLELDEDETHRLLEASLIVISSLWYVPYLRNPFFSGRASILQHLHELLNEKDQQTTSQICALRGLGGIGKTEIAREYAYRSAQIYTGVFWLDATSQTSISDSFSGIAQILHVSDQQEMQLRIFAVLRWFTTHSGWLLIVDSVQDIDFIKPYLPPARRGSILLTTRLQSLQGLAKSITVPKLPLEENILFLSRRTGKNLSAQIQDVILSEHRILSEIAELTDGLPLATEQIGAYIEDVQCSYEDFLNLFYEDAPRFLFYNVSSKNTSLASMFSIIFEELQEKDDSCIPFLKICSLLAIAPIPEELFTGHSGFFEPLLQKTSIIPLKFNNICRYLLSYSLINRETDTCTFILPGLVQVLLRNLLSEAERLQMIKQLIHMLVKIFPTDFTDANYASQCSRFFPHILACIMQAEELKIHSLQLAMLLDRTGNYLFYQQSLDEAEQLFLRACAIRECLQGYNHPDIAPLLNWLAVIYTEQGRYIQGQKTYERAISILQQCHEADQLCYADCLHGQAILAREQQQLSKAKFTLQEALHIRKRLLGEKHLWIAITLNDLAQIYMRLGDQEQAENLFIEAIETCEYSNSVIDTHPYLAHCLYGLATLYNNQGKPQQAHPLFEQVLRIRQSNTKMRFFQGRMIL